MTTPDPTPRLVSLHPAATDALAALHALPWLVGRTHRCDLPPPFNTPPTLTDPDRPDVVDLATLAALRPSLVIAHAPEPAWPVDPRAVLATLTPPPRLLLLSPTTVEDVLDDLLRIGEALVRSDAALLAVVGLRERLLSAREFVNAYTEPPRVAILVDTDPPRVAGGWLVQLLERAGGRHPLNPCVPRPGAGAAAGMQASERLSGPSREVTLAELAAADLDAVIIAPRGQRLDRALQAARDLASRPGWADLPAVRAGRVAVLDGVAAGLASPRIADLMDWMVAWLNDRPDVAPPGVPWKVLDAHARPGR